MSNWLYINEKYRMTLLDISNENEILNKYKDTMLSVRPSWMRAKICQFIKSTYQDTIFVIVPGLTDQDVMLLKLMGEHLMKLSDDALDVTADGDDIVYTGSSSRTSKTHEKKYKRQIYMNYLYTHSRFCTEEELKQLSVFQDCLITGIDVIGIYRDRYIGANYIQRTDSLYKYFLLQDVIPECQVMIKLYGYRLQELPGYVYTYKLRYGVLHPYKEFDNIPLLTT